MLTYKSAPAFRPKSAKYFADQSKLHREERWKSAQCKLDLLVLTHIDCNQTEKFDIFCRSIRTRRRTNVLEPRVRKGARCSAEAQGASEEESVHCVSCFGTVEQLSEAATATEELVLAEKESEATYL